MVLRRDIYYQATDCGNTSNSYNVNHIKKYYNMTGDPFREFGILEDALILFSLLTCAVQAKANSADGAAFNSLLWQHESSCLQNTRYGLTIDIMHWSGNPYDACIFWLSGMAGTGKSTISRTVARRWYDESRLGASFFFSRGQGDLANASKFFSTLACSWHTHSPASPPPFEKLYSTIPISRNKAYRTNGNSLSADRFPRRKTCHLN